jgi:hypothetical protein
MAAIDQTEDEKLPQLTAREFYKQRTDFHFPANTYQKVLEFAEAYAKEQVRGYEDACTSALRELAARQALLRRAAELLTDETLTSSDFFDKRDQWLKDAGMDCPNPDFTGRGQDK